MNVDEATDQARFTEVFVPYLVDAFRLAPWLAKNRPKDVVFSDDLDQHHREQIEQAATDQMQTPETALIAKLEAEQVRKAIAALPAPFREILVLREIHDLDYRTIAEVAALPIGTVMSRLARARRLLSATIATGIP